MDDHVRQRRKFLPKLVAEVPLQIEDWVRDDLPDLLWPALVLAQRGTKFGASFVRWQDAVQRDLRGQVDIEILAECLDGRLTSLDRLVGELPGAAASVKLRATELGLLPPLVADLLTSYPERPAAWLVEGDLHPPDQAQVDLCAKAVLEALSDGHREAIIKCLPVWSAVQAGTFRSSAETIELLKFYPNDEESRSRSDSVVRAIWGASKGLRRESEPAQFDDAIQWAKIFWGINSISTKCVRKRDSTSSSGDMRAGDNGNPYRVNAMPPGGEHLRRMAMDLLASYVEALDTAPSQLYEPEPQEVHGGLVARVGHELIAVLGSPDLWGAEHGSHLTRALIEVRIYLQWMASQEASIYRQFQEYGSGKAKLYARIMDEMPAEDRLPGFDAGIDELTRLSHTDGGIDYRIVDTGDSFSGKSIRAMADECGLLDFYRHGYSIASGVAHSEWWSVETHAMERCLNVLHRVHLIPSLSLSAGGDVSLATSWLEQFHGLVRASLFYLGTDETAVAQAFSWHDDHNESADDGGNER